MVYTITTKCSAIGNLLLYGTIIQRTRNKKRGGALVERIIRRFPKEWVEHREFFPFLMGMQTALQRGYQKVVIRSYNNNIRKVLKNNRNRILKQKENKCSNETHKEILALLKEFEEIKFGWIKRGKLHQTYSLINMAKGIFSTEKVTREEPEYWTPSKKNIIEDDFSEDIPF